MKTNTKSHYLTAEEREIKVREINKLEEDPNYLITLTFHKDASGWYAEVPTHTRGENAMVAGADIVVARMAAGDNTVEVKFRTSKSETLTKPLCTLRRIEHDPCGGTYLVSGMTLLPFPAWLCNVTHDVTGEHPVHMYVHKIKHYNKEG